MWWPYQPPHTILAVESDWALSHMVSNWDETQRWSFHVSRIGVQMQKVSRDQNEDYLSLWTIAQALPTGILYYLKTLKVGFMNAYLLALSLKSLTNSCLGREFHSTFDNIWCLRNVPVVNWSGGLWLWPRDIYIKKEVCQTFESIFKRERGNYYIRAYISFIQHKTCPLQICCWIISNGLEKTHSRSLKLIMVS